MTTSLLDLWFVGALVALVVARRFVPDRHLGTFGAIASCALIGIGAPTTLLAIGGTTAFFLYPLAKWINHLKREEATAHRARVVMRVGVAVLVAAMVLFKVHTHFRLPFLGDGTVAHAALHLIGFSYFLFRAINYLYMQVLSPAGAGRLGDVLFYVLFPSTLTSGPIQKYLDFKRELDRPRPLTGELLGTAVYRITKGYFFKLCLGFVMLKAVGALVATDELYAWESIATTAALYLYFFFDFAGYCHVAIGLGLLLGIKVPENFRQPFLATSITEFWRHWHITLVEWFRDHIFTAFGGMRASRLKASSLAFLIMFLVGLWHGLSWSCLIWGCWHGLLLFVEGMTGSRPMPPAKRRGWPYWRRVAWTNTRVGLGELLFLATPGIGTWDDFWRVAEGFARWW